MKNLTASHFEITLLARTRINLGRHKGTTLRGLLIESLRGPEDDFSRGFCTQRHLAACEPCPFRGCCQVAAIVGVTQAEEGSPRNEVTRPFALKVNEPEHTEFVPGESLRFGVTLFGPAITLLTHLILALRQAEKAGVGQKPGRFELQQIDDVNLLTGERKPLLSPGDSSLHAPAWPIDSDQVEARVETLLEQGGNEIEVNYLTPTQITIAKGKTAHRPDFNLIMKRLLGRLDVLGYYYAGVAWRPVAEERQLIELAAKVETVLDESRWIDQRSHSRRSAAVSDISGIVGRVVYRARPEIWRELLSVLVWGEVIQLGKSTAKGNGWMRLGARRN